MITIQDEIIKQKRKKCFFRFNLIHSFSCFVCDDKYHINFIVEIDY